MNERARQMTIAWMLICLTLIAISTTVILDNIRLHDELAKPVRPTMQQRHEIIKAYLAVGENRWALKQQIGCTDKE